MKSLLAVFISTLFLTACSAGVELNQKEGFTPRTQPQTVFVVPFTTIMVPDEVSAGLFDRFVDQLNTLQNQKGLEYIILKQGREAIDAQWLNARDYVTGEVFAYVEEVGSSTASIRAKSRISLFQTGQAGPTLQLDYPVEIFYEKDYATLAEIRQKLAVKIADNLSLRLSDALAGR